MTETAPDETGFPRLVVRFGHDVDAAPNPMFLHALSSVPEMLFERRGIVSPTIALMPDRELGAGDAVLEIDGARVGEVEYFALGESVTKLLDAHAERLVVAPLVDFYLSRLRATAPILISTVRRRFAMADLVKELRALIRTGGSLKDLQGILETILAETPAGAADIVG